MEWLAGIWRRLRTMIRSTDLDLEDELAFHLAMREAKNRAADLPGNVLAGRSLWRTMPAAQPRPGSDRDRDSGVGDRSQHLELRYAQSVGHPGGLVSPP